MGRIQARRTPTGLKKIAPLCTVATGFRKRSCATKKLERDDDSKKNHHALVFLMGRAWPRASDQPGARQSQSVPRPQTLYASTKDHLGEFATLRAIGSPRGYIYRVILFQALLSAIIGFAIANSAGAVLAHLSTHSALPVVLIRLPLVCRGCCTRGLCDPHAEGVAPNRHVAWAIGCNRLPAVDDTVTPRNREYAPL